MREVSALAQEIMRVRIAQLLINERYKAAAFRIPIHLALGHEAIAVAVSAVMGPEDRLVLPHRNLHYNLARGASLKSVLDEFSLKPEGLAGGALGSMNLCHEAAGVAYSSSILGNNLGVGAGVALAARMKGTGGVTFIVTGDGAMEEGAFHECLVMLRAQDLAALVIVENNEWSMATRIDERRRPVDLAALAAAYGAGYESLAGNDIAVYVERLIERRATTLAEKRPAIVEVRLSTIGDWRQDGRFVNYHAGPAVHVAMRPWPPARESDEDPVHALRGRLGDDRMETLASETLARLEAEIA